MLASKSSQSLRSDPNTVPASAWQPPPLRDRPEDNPDPDIAMANASKPPKDRDDLNLNEQLERKSGANLEEWGRFAGHGIQFAIILGLFAFGGMKLDDWLGTEPWLLLLMLFLGFTGATVSLVKQLPVSEQNRKP